MNKWTGGALLAGLTLAGVPALAQDVESLESTATAPQAQPADQTAKMPIAVSTGVSHQFDADIDKNNGGSFSVTRFNVAAVVPVRLNDDWKLTSSVRYQLDSYNFDVGGGSPMPTTWDEINNLTVASIAGWRLDDNWSLYGGGILKVAAEGGASWGQATTGGGLVGFNYKVDDTLSLGLGIAALSQIENDATVLPIITAKWKFADNWLLNVGLTDVATTGYGADVKWLFNQEWDFDFGLQFHKSRFRIDGTAATGTKDGVGQESAGILYASSTWHPNDKLDLTGYVGLAGGGKLRVDNSSGDKQFQSDYDTAAVIGAKASIRF